jgi:uroporphyrinogen-III synthase
MKPLAGKRVLITRAREQSSRLRQLLESAGAEVIAIPTIEIVPPDSYAALDTALRNLASYDWLVLTSANAVHAMDRRAAEIGVALAPQQIAAIGKATAEVISAIGLKVDIIPPRAVAEALADELAPHVHGKRVQLIRAEVARDLLPESLSAAGAFVTIAEAYKTIIPQASAQELREAHQRGIDAITFTSASSVQNFLGLARSCDVSLTMEPKKISIGPITSASLKENGLSVDAEAEEATMEALVAAVVRLF